MNFNPVGAKPVGSKPFQSGAPLPNCRVKDREVSMKTGSVKIMDRMSAVEAIKGLGEFTGRKSERRKVGSSSLRLAAQPQHARFPASGSRLASRMIIMADSPA